MTQREYTQNGWNEYKLLVIKSLEGLDKKNDILDNKIEIKMKILEDKLDERTKAIEDKIDLRVGEVRDRIDVLKDDVTVLKTKAIIYGGIAGLVIAVVIQLLFVLLKLR